MPPTGKRKLKTPWNGRSDAALLALIRGDPVKEWGNLAAANLSDADFDLIETALGALVEVPISADDENKVRDLVQRIKIIRGTLFP